MPGKSKGHSLKAKKIKFYQMSPMLNVSHIERVRQQFTFIQKHSLGRMRSRALVGTVLRTLWSTVGYRASRIVSALAAEVREVL